MMRFKCVWNDMQVIYIHTETIEKSLGMCSVTGRINNYGGNSSQIILLSVYLRVICYPPTQVLRVWTFREVADPVVGGARVNLGRTVESRPRPLERLR